MAAPSTGPYDIAVAGAGIFGLSIAHAAIRAGLKTVVLEADRVGAGSSGGLLGALMPHMPARWNPKKEFQFQALSGLEGHVSRLEAETGLSCGYRRCGRILPLTTADRLAHHRERAEESKLRWHPDRSGFTYQVEAPGSRSDWLYPEAAPFGIVYETLAARISPRAYLAALAAHVRRHGTLMEGAEVTGFDETTRQVQLSGSAAPVAAGCLVISGGFRAFDLIESLTGENVGRGEKGQALLLEGAGLSGRPAIYCDGLYVVPHDDGTVAVGSTSDREFTDSAPSPERTDELLRRATAFCPALAGRAVLSQWAGIRPRCHKRDPLIGPLPGSHAIHAATGGFKISFGIAHLVADCLIADITGREAAHRLPATFRPDNHFGTSRLDADG
ncbi:FAD-dependent oxidoreductase [Labrenzia sp. 011]|uniref:NAD(P)/FAD-dependent oxidoreductase n=1 Tax=Labrenzia sp. 011 TaxID=2171494 RepID=UPI000D51CA61|nr:FAD-dependent oxidoreductase [Labrenzia sp. 011]PVB60825.1 FAD-dependent oxidoreductase [Labrenzia sp. 011]